MRPRTRNWVAAVRALAQSGMPGCCRVAATRAMSAGMVTKGWHRSARSISKPGMTPRLLSLLASTHPADPPDDVYVVRVVQTFNLFSSPSMHVIRSYMTLHICTSWLAQISRIRKTLGFFPQPVDGLPVRISLKLLRGIKWEPARASMIRDRLGRPALATMDAALRQP